MLDMGFVHDVRRIAAAVPSRRQTMLFSATIPKPIESLANSLLSSPVRVSIEPEVRTAELVEQSVAVFVDRGGKRALLEQGPARRRRHARHCLHADQARGQPPFGAAAPRRNRRHGHPRQQVAERTPARARGVPSRLDARPRRHRRRRTRHRRRRHLPRHQLRPPQRRGELRPSHRPNGSCRLRGSGHLVLRSGRARPPGRHRALHPHAPARSPRAETGPVTLCSRHERAVHQGVRGRSEEARSRRRLQGRKGPAAGARG